MAFLHRHWAKAILHEVRPSSATSCGAKLDGRNDGHGHGHDEIMSRTASPTTSPNHYYLPPSDGTRKSTSSLESSGHRPRSP